MVAATGHVSLDLSTFLVNEGDLSTFRFDGLLSSRHRPRTIHRPTATPSARRNTSVRQPPSWRLGLGRPGVRPPIRLRAPHVDTEPKSPRQTDEQRRTLSSARSREMMELNLSRRHGEWRRRGALSVEIYVVASSRRRGEGSSTNELCLHTWWRCTLRSCCALSAVALASGVCEKTDDHGTCTRCLYSRYELRMR